MSEINPHLLLEQVKLCYPLPGGLENCASQIAKRL
jgi:hypothetical protein